MGRLDELKALGPGGLARQFGAVDNAALRTVAGKILEGADPARLKRELAAAKKEIEALQAEVAKLKRELATRGATAGSTVAPGVTLAVDPVDLVDPTERQRMLKREKMRRYRERKKAGETT
jgi:hypothetical protein